MMNYEEKYNAALERAETLIEKLESVHIKGFIYHIFPELIEDKSEKIRKELIDYINRLTASPNNIDKYNTWIAWLEKQGKKESDPRYKYLEDLLTADDIHQMSMNEAMVEEAKSKAVNALSKLGILKLLGLEKQGEQKSIFNADDWYVSKVDGKIHNIYQSVDKIEPKFRVGDWVILNGIVAKILDKQKYGFVGLDIDGKDFFCNYGHTDSMRLWTINDAKDGDVLVTEDYIFIFKYILHGGVHRYCHYKFDDEEFDSDIPDAVIGNIRDKGIHFRPATKEQRDLLFQKMKEAGYEWNAEKKELKKMEATSKESEDEITRKSLIRFLKSPFVHENIIDEKVDPWIAWLEKQGEQPTKIEPKFKVGDIVQYITDSTDRRKIEEIDTLCNMYHTDSSPIMFEIEDEWKVVVNAEDVEHEFVNNVEPKFHEDDWIVFNGLILHIDEVVNGYYRTTSIGDGIHNSYDWDIDNAARLWTINDAKDGDVLFHSDSASNGIFIFKEILQHVTMQEVICYCDYDSEDGFCLGEKHTCCWTDSKILHPATKKQRDLLENAITGAGYKWNAEKKELKKLNYD